MLLVNVDDCILAGSGWVLGLALHESFGPRCADQHAHAATTLQPAGHAAVFQQGF